MIKTGIVGYGFAGRSFHSYLIGLAKGLTLSTIATRDPVRQAAAEVEQGVATCETIDDLLKDEEIQLVVKGHSRGEIIGGLTTAERETIGENCLFPGVETHSNVLKCKANLATGVTV